MTIVYNKDGIEFDLDSLITDVNNKLDRDVLNHGSNVVTLIPDLTHSKAITNGMVLDDYYFLVGSGVVTNGDNSKFELFVDGIEVMSVGWSGGNWSTGGAYSNLLIPNQTITINNSSYLGTLKLYKAKIHVATITN